MIVRALVVLALLSVAPSLALAQATDARAEARVHFDRGIELFNEGHLDAALAELQRAYELAPAFPVLYNLARVHAELGHPVDAARAYQRYLDEGGAQVPDARRTEVEAALRRQRDRIGTILVVTSLEGAVISLDGVDVATTPAGPIEAGVGAHTVGVRAPGREAITRAVAVASRTEARVEVDLRAEIAARGTLAITTSVPAVTITLDGTAVGVTPLPGTIPVPPGDHEVRAERAGYVTDARRVSVEDGGEYQVFFRMEADPDPHPSSVGALALRLPDGPHAVRIDGEDRILRGPLQLPIGDHVVEVQVAEREPWLGHATIAAEQTLELAPPLRWTVEAHRARLDAAHAMEAGGIGTTIAGGALLVAGLALIGWNESEVASTDGRVRMVMDEQTALRCLEVDVRPMCRTLRDEQAALTSAQGVQDVLRPISITTAVLGAAMITLGVVLWVSAPTDEGIEASAHAELVLGPGSLALRGTY